MRYGCGKALELGLVCSCGMEAAFKAPLAELPECVLRARLGRRARARGVAKLKVASSTFGQKDSCAHSAPFPSALSQRVSSSPKHDGSRTVDGESAPQ